MKREKKVFGSVAISRMLRKQMLVANGSDLFRLETDVLRELLEAIERRFPAARRES